MTLPHDPSALRDREYREAYVEGHVKSYIPFQLRAIREKLRLTQKAFAERIGKPQSVVSRLENTEYGKVTVQTLLDIARRLDIALVVKFASFREFLAAYADLSADVMAVEPFAAEESPSLANLQSAARLEKKNAESVAASEPIFRAALPVNAPIIIPQAAGPAPGYVPAHSGTSGTDISPVTFNPGQYLSSASNGIEAYVRHTQRTQIS